MAKNNSEKKNLVKFFNYILIKKDVLIISVYIPVVSYKDMLRRSQQKETALNQYWGCNQNYLKIKQKISSDGSKNTSPKLLLRIPIY